MGGGSSKKNSGAPAATPPPQAAPAAPPPPPQADPVARDPYPVDGPKAPAQPPAALPPPPVKADAYSSASKSIGGPPPKAQPPSPQDDVLFSEWVQANRIAVFSGICCTVPYSVTVVLERAGKDALSKADAEQKINEVLGLAASVFSHFEADSEVSKINAMKDTNPVKVSSELAVVLDMADALNRMTRGTFDVGLLHVFKALESGQPIPTDKTWNNGFAYSASPDGGKQIAKKDVHCELDVCGLAKGYIVDAVTDGLKELGVTSAFVDWGGDVKVIGTHPAGRTWCVLVQEPPGVDMVEKPTGTYIGVFQLRCGEALATSGDYAKTLTAGGKLCTPVVRGKKELVDVGYSGLCSASIVARSCMVADALATASLATSEPKKVRELLKPFHVPASGPVSVEACLDYLLYTREGPRVIRRPKWTQTTDDNDTKRTQYTSEVRPHVVVIGGGLAGISAVIEAQKAGASVTLLEKEEKIGGNSAKATSGINGWGTHTQLANKITDEGKYFERDTFKSALGGKANPQLIQTLSHKSSSAVNWLIDELGVPLTVLSQLGGHSAKRTHRAPPLEDGTPVPIGYKIMSHCEAYVRAMDRVEIRTGVVMKELMQTEGRVSGVKIAPSAGGDVEEIAADSVVLCTGGFACDGGAQGLMSEWRPDLMGVATTCGSFSTGDGMKAASSIGANLVDMEKVQLHPTGFIDPANPTAHTKYLGPEALRGSGGILLNQKGERFIDELNLRSVVSQAILGNCDNYPLPDGSQGPAFAYCLLNADAQKLFGPPQLKFYRDQQGLFQNAENIAEIASIIGCDEESVRSTLAAYGAAADTTYCSKTDKSVFPCKMCDADTGFVIARVTPVIHYCMGGVQINAAGEAQQQAMGSFSKKSSLPGLYAAGEVTGGVHGENRLGGNSLLDCVVFGRIAGQRAALIKTPGECMNTSDWKPVVLREARDTGPNTAMYRFNLFGSQQSTGAPLGGYIAIRGNLDGDLLTGYYSPVSRPDDCGQIDILARTDDKGGPITSFLTQLLPGGEAEMKAMDGPQIAYNDQTRTWSYKGRTVRKISMLAGGTGLAPMIQLTRAYMRDLSLSPRSFDKKSEGLKLMYAAEEENDLAFCEQLGQVAGTRKDVFEQYFVLNRPPVGWTQGIGFVTPQLIKEKLWYPPADDHFILICGPPIFEKIMCSNLAKLGYPRDTYYAFSEG